MTSDSGIIVQLPRGGAVDHQLRADPPPSVAGGKVVLDHIARDPSGRLGPPDAGEVVMSVLSPEALAREPYQVSNAIRRAAATDEPLVIIVQAAAELREDELAVVLDAAAHTHRHVIVRIMGDA